MVSILFIASIWSPIAASPVTGVFEKQSLLSDCKTITLKTGEVLRVLVMSMDELQISYVPCDETDADEKLILFEKVDKITSDDGDVSYKAYNRSLELEPNYIALIRAMVIGVIVLFGTIIYIVKIL